MTLPAIKKFFQENKVPDSMDLTPHGHIFNLPKFVESHLSILEKNMGNERFRPYYDRVITVIKKIKESEPKNI